MNTTKQNKKPSAAADKPAQQRALARNSAGWWHIGAPTWGNDGQDEARACAYIEGVNFAAAQFDKGAR